MRFRNGINQFETRKDNHRLYLCLLHKGRSYLLGGPKAVFESFVSSRNSLNINFYRYQDLVLFLRQFARKSVDDLWNLASRTSSIVCLQNLMSQFVLQLSIHPSIELFPITIFNHPALRSNHSQITYSIPSLLQIR